MTKIAIAGGDTDTPLNMRKRVQLIASLVPVGARVLDAGCGKGEYVAALSSLGRVAFGIEYSDEKVSAWRAKYPGDSRVQQGDIASLAYPDESIDAVILNEVLEHVPDDASALREVARVLRRGGMLIMFSPNRLYPFETHGVDSRNGRRRIPPIATFGLPYLPASLTHRMVRPWARNYWPWQLRALVRSAGFDVRYTSTVWQTFENISGRQPRALAAVRPVLRLLSLLFERTPLIRWLGVSQLIVAAKKA